MKLEEAQLIIGRTNSAEPFLSNMIKALKIHSWLNTEEENERLEAAILVKKHRANQKRYAARKANDEARKSCGLTKVRGNLGGTYWE